MKPGNLVRTIRAGIGIPAGTLGLIMDSLNVNDGIHIQVVKLLGRSRCDRRYLARDLEVISESR
jgi:hypothetical protein